MLSPVPCPRILLIAVCLAFAWVPALAQQPTNLAASANGGSLVAFGGHYNESEWRAVNLIDGSAQSGWAAPNQFPQAVIIAFQNHRLARVEDVLINPYTRENANNWVKEVEVLVSQDHPFRSFRSLGKFTLANEGRNQLFPIQEPVQARYLKVIFHSNYGGGYMECGEIQVMGSLLGEAGSGPGYVNLAAAASGAAVESYSSQYNDADWAAANLLAEDGLGGWAGKNAESQEIVIALPESAQITDVAVNNYVRERSDNWAKEVEIAVSTSSPYKGFVPVGRLVMPPIGDLHGLRLETPVTARYVRFFFRSNHGGPYMEAGRVRVYSASGDSPEKASVAQQLEKTGRAVIHEIHFATNSAEILPESERVLQEIAQFMSQNPTMQLMIEGHTDSVGGPEFNRELSSRRAESVKTWLVHQAGVDSQRLNTVGYGLEQPVADNSTEQGRAQNRRVELKVRR